MKYHPTRTHVKMAYHSFAKGVKYVNLKMKDTLGKGTLSQIQKRKKAIEDMIRSFYGPSKRTSLQA